MRSFLMTLPVWVPVVFWAIYHYHKDRHLPEPPGHLLLAFVLGMLAAGLSQLMYISLGPLRFDAGALADSNPLGLLAYALLAIGPIEETAKAIPFLIVILRLEELDEPLDGIIYASFIGLGYAAVENWQYLDYLTTQEAIARGFASPVVHILFASLWGHRIVAAKLNGQRMLPVAITWLAIASLLHGVYDFLVILNPVYALPTAALMIAALWVWRLRLMRRLHLDAKAASAAKMR